MKQNDITRLDPRAFLDSQSYLWVSQSQNPKTPLMTGNIIIPVRLIDFIKEYSEQLPIGGEHCIKLSVAYWEAKNKYYSKHPPQYRGKLSVFTPLLYEPYNEEYRKARHIQNITLILS